MLTPPTPETHHEENELLVCGLCGRVNQVATASSTRTQAVRCSGCGAQLRNERSRRVATECPSCQRRLEVEEDWLGQTVRCGACGAGFEARRLGGMSLPGAKPAPAAMALRRTDSVPVAVPQPEPDPLSPDSRSKVRRRRRKKRKVRAVEIPWGLIFASLLTFGLVGTIIGMVGQREGWWQSAKARPPGTDAAQPAGPDVPVMAGSEIAALNEVVRAFLGCATFEEQAPYVRFPGEFGESLASFKGQVQPDPIKVASVEQMQEQAVNGRLFLRVAGIETGGKRKEITIERTGPGQFLVDWQSYVRFATAEWDVFVAKRSTDPQTFQVFLRRDVVGHPDFPVEKFSAYQVHWRSIEDGIPLFVPRGSTEDMLLQQATEPTVPARLFEPVQPPVGTSMATVSVFFHAQGGAGVPPALQLSKLRYVGWVSSAHGELSSSSEAR